MSAKIEQISGNGPYCYKISGEVYHRTSENIEIDTSLQPNCVREMSQPPSYAELYVYDTDISLEARMLNSANAQCRRENMIIISTAINEVSPYASCYKKLREVYDKELSERRAINLPMNKISLIFIRNTYDDQRAYNAPRNTDDVAIVFVADRDGNIPAELDFSVQPNNSNSLKRINMLSKHLDPMYLVFAYARYEANKISFIRNNQKTLRVESYQGLLDHVNDLSRNNNARIGNLFILPSSFVSGPRFMSKLYQDNMAMVRKFGRPDLFITFTCNPKWSEILSELKSFQNSSDRQDLVIRVFNLKLKEFLDDIVKKRIFGEVIAYVYVIEHQKRGFPYAHCLFTLSSQDKIRTSDDVNSIISAEIPSQEQHPDLYTKVLIHNIHGPCGQLNPNSICMIDESCTKNFPKPFCSETDASNDGYPIYKRRNNSNERHFVRNNIKIDNRFVVPYNPFLTMKYNAHINVEICSTVKAIKYIHTSGPYKT
ncbi:uncharacterized protein LOC129616004 [Condylostylus longicornis]|uniref:uncharacterized protein LOC129616004 n=1 Tax=Condylostylus longicornis TaxID=2530218 RepID=UPI00244E3FB9|nr:uncharacterized protein LOC129616004 [Condylostylus longicornis]